MYLNSKALSKLNSTCIHGFNGKKNIWKENGGDFCGLKKLPKKTYVFQKTNLEIKIKSY